MIGLFLLTLLSFLSITPLALAQTSSSMLGTIAGGLILRISNVSQDASSSLYFISGSGGPGENNKAGEVKSVINSTNPFKSTLELYSTGVFGKGLSSDSKSWNGSINTRNTGLRILPEGSVLMGGWSNNELNPGIPTNETPLNLPDYQLNDLPQNKRNSGIYDFFFSMPTPDDPKSKAGLFIRQLVVGDNSNPTNIIIRRGQGNHPEDQIHYGQLGPLNVGGTSIGTIKWEGYTRNGFRTAAAIAASLDDIKNPVSNPNEIYAKGSLNFATSGPEEELTNRMVIDSNGDVTIFKNLNLSGGSKNFLIDYPGRPGVKLVHAAIEGPEAAVYYRGEGQLSQGEAEIVLPEYFEKLTRREGRTIQLTGIDGFDKLAVKTKNGVQIKDGKFVVYSDNSGSAQKFNWEVKAVRADISELRVIREE
jgi:hypothetical protein